MTAPQSTATTDPQSIVAALQQRLDAALLEKAALAEELAARDAALAQRNSEYGERIEHQVATLDVLKAMSASPGDPQPVFDLIVEHASKLCNVPTATLFEYDGALVHIRSAYRVETVVAVSPWAVANEHFPMRPTRGSITCRAILDRQIIHVRDLNADRELAGFVRALGHRSQVSVPLMRDGTAIGVISIAAQEPGGFSDSQVALLQTFAEQAVIAITSAETYRGLHEALEQQTATAEVLRVINTSPGNLRPVFDAMLERALRLCGAAFGGLSTFDGDRRTIMASTPAYEAYVTAEGATSVIPPLMLRVIETKCPVQIADRRDREGFRAGSSVRTLLHVPLLKDETVLGCITVYRQEVRPYSDKEIALLQNFAAQAVIAMENARLLTEQREALEQQTATAEVLQVINASPGNLAPVFDAMLEKAMRLCEAAFGSLYTNDGERFHSAAQRGVPPAYTASRANNPPTLVQNSGMQTLVAAKRTFHVPDVKARDNYRTGEPGARALVDLGGARTLLSVPLVKDDALVGFFTIYRQEVREFSEKQIALLENFAAQAVIAMENARLLGELRTALDTTQTTLRDLKTAQANLIQAEKMASLGQLTAGIAHEIKNPLNFVNNFAELSVDLLGELKDAISPVEAGLNPDLRDEVDEVVTTLTSNLEKITEYGRRADGIVKAMLEHSRGSSAERRMVDLNAVIDEALNLAYHGARAQDQSFNITLERDFTEGMAPIEVNPQDITRVFLNIFSNGFYATTRRARNNADAGFMPMLKVTTRDTGETVEIRVRDNGTGIPADIMDKLFEPFFTTKPTGEGTGLGLSITYDIVTKQHGGTITVDSEVDAFSEFVVTLPRTMFANGGSRA